MEARVQLAGAAAVLGGGVREGGVGVVEVGVGGASHQDGHGGVVEACNCEEQTR